MRFWFESVQAGGIAYMITLTALNVTLFPFVNEGDPTDPEEIDFEDWEIETEGKGQNRRISCKGVGHNALVTMTLVRTS